MRACVYVYAQKKPQKKNKKTPLHSLFPLRRQWADLPNALVCLLLFFIGNLVIIPFNVFKIVIERSFDMCSVNFCHRARSNLRTPVHISDYCINSL